MTRDEARQFVRSRNQDSPITPEILHAHGLVLAGGMIGAGDSAKLIEIADALSALCLYLAHNKEKTK